METTKDLHFIGGEYTEFRYKEVHQKIIDNVMSTHTEKVDSPTSILLGGGSASGKSEHGKLIIKGYQKENTPFVYIDADEIKKMIPEYIAMQNSKDEKIKEASAAYVHDESSDLAEKILYLCIQERMNFIYDGTMKNAPKYQRFIEDLRSACYTIQGIIVDVPVDVAIQRATERFDIEGRMVPIKDIRLSHSKVAETFELIKSLLDSYIMYDNTTKPPEAFAWKISDEAGEEVKDQDRLKQFLNKALFDELRSEMELKDQK